MSHKSKKANQLSAQQRLLRALKEARAKLEAMERSRSEPIAIIGMGCRFPGAENPEAFWQLLRNGVDAVKEIPPTRWDVQAYYDPDPEAPGKMYTRSAAMIEQVDHFDPHFFGISPREAISLDPQQRLLLEVSWEALEHAGQAPDKLVDSRTGVFIGIGQNDYVQLLGEVGSLEELDIYAGTGSGFCYASGRLSYTLGLQGPNMAIDTACSSSLVALHLAVMSLRLNESDMALAGGVHLILSPESTVMLSKMGALSPDGRCKTFDASADGYGRGEGCGMVVLKRLSDAEANGDHILAVIRGSAVNHDGPSSGLTVPNTLAQEALIRQALANAKVHTKEITYIESHGTGTSLGDPLEVQAIGRVFRASGRHESGSLILGSVKTNIGHLEAAAGIASLIKVVLSLQHGEIPPHLHFQQPNPLIPWDRLPIKVPTEVTEWPGTSVAGISSFGISGTNAHVIVGAYVGPPPTPSNDRGGEGTMPERRRHVLTLSAKTEEALDELVARYKKALTAYSDISLANISFTANTGRAHFEHRLALVAQTVTEAREKLSAMQAGEQPTGMYKGLDQDNRPQIAFLFTGQGSQYVGMGRQLYKTEPVFRQALERCNEILRDYLERPLLSVLYPTDQPTNLPTNLLNQTAYTQPALFAIEYALAELWKSWGIQPDIVMGHSVGEYAAACVAGVLSLEDGLKLIAERGRLMQALPRGGEMAAVFADEQQVAQVIRPYSRVLSIAAINGPQSVVISGKRWAVRAVLKTLQAEGIKSKQLAVSHAFHSALMAPMLKRFEQVAQQVTYSEQKIDFVSNVTGHLATTAISTPEYWVNHVSQPVRFADGINTLYRDLNMRVFVEIGPKATLLGMARRALPTAPQDREGQGEKIELWLPSLRPKRDDWEQMLSTLSQLYVHGVSVNWSGFYAASRDQGESLQHVVLPTYPWKRTRYWVEVSSRGRKPSPIDAPKDWLYRVEWQAKARIQEQIELETSHSWLIVSAGTESHPLVQALADLLESHQQQLILLDLATDSTNLEHILDSIDKLSHVIWIAHDRHEAPFDEALNHCGQVLHLVQALSKQSVTCRLWLVTQGALSIGEHAIALTQAPLWGLGKVIALEEPQLWSGLIDLESGDWGVKSLLTCMGSNLYV